MRGLLCACDKTARKQVLFLQNSELFLECVLKLILGVAYRGSSDDSLQLSDALNKVGCCRRPQSTLFLSSVLPALVSSRVGNRLGLD